MGASLRRGRETWLCYAFLAIYSFFINSMGPITPLLKADLGLSYAAASLHYTAFALGLFLVGVIGHGPIERLGARASLWVGAFGLSLGALPFILGRAAPVTVLGAFIMGFVGTLILVVVPTTLSDLHPEGRAVAISEANTFASALAAASPLFLGYCSRLLGDWRPGLALGAAVPVLMIPLLVATRRQASPAAPRAAPATAPQGGLPGLYWAYWACLVLGVMAEFGMISWASDFLVTVHGLEKGPAATALSLFLGAMVLGRFLGSRLGTRFAPRTVLLASIATAFLGFFLFWLPRSLAPSLGGLFLTGLGIASLYPFLLGQAIEVAGPRAVEASARATMASGAAIMGLPICLGAAADAFGIRDAYAIVPLVLVALAGLVAWSTARARGSRSRAS